MTSWAELRARAAARLEGLAIRPETEGSWIIEELSGYDRAELLVHEQEIAPPLAVARLDELLDRRAGGEPLQYVLGRWRFLDLELFVDSRVLVPRPETEIVARTAIEEAVRLGARRGQQNGWLAADTSHAVADLGTGSGAIALTMARELPDAEVWATDASDDALAVARANLGGIGSAATRVRISAGSWFEALPEERRREFTVIVSNPPYVAVHEIADLPADVAEWEPRGALVSGPTGFEAIEVLVAGAAEWLDPTGSALVVEIAPAQAVRATELATSVGFGDVRIEHDLAGRARVLVARLADEGRSSSR